MQVDLLQVIQTLMAAQNLQVTLSTPPFDGLQQFDFGLRQSLDPVFGVRPDAAHRSAGTYADFYGGYL